MEEGDIDSQGQIWSNRGHGMAPLPKLNKPSRDSAPQRGVGNGFLATGNACSVRLLPIRFMMSTLGDVPAGFVGSESPRAQRRAAFRPD